MSQETVPTPVPADPAEIVERVRDRYAGIAAGNQIGCGCGATAAIEAIAADIGYGDELAAIPEEANLGLGCGAPLAALALAPGETVVDLGSGGGIDVFLAARAVGSEGRAIGVDMTPEMIERARATAAKAGYDNVEFRQGRLEALPLEDGSVDAATSNCVFNLVPDKAAVFAEVARVLKPGGRLVVSDIILDRALPEALERDLVAWTGCVAGAMRRDDYFAKLAASGLSEVEVVRDVDYAASLAKAAPEEAAEILGRLGLTAEDVAGAIRSVTYRATKPGEPRAEAEACDDMPCCGDGCCT